MQIIKLRLILLLLFQTTLFLTKRFKSVFSNFKVAHINTFEIKSTMSKIANKILERTNYNLFSIIMKWYIAN